MQSVVTCWLMHLYKGVCSCICIRMFATVVLAATTLGIVMTARVIVYTYSHVLVLRCYAHH